MAWVGLTSRHAMAETLMLKRGGSLRTFVGVSARAAQPMPQAPSQHVQRQQPTLHKSKRKGHTSTMLPVQTLEPAQMQAAKALAAFSSCRALVLDSSYRPIDVVTWQRAICLDLFDKVDVLEYFEGLAIRSAREEHMIPAVLRVRFYVKRNWKGAKLTLSRRNLMLRDRFCCQYCGSRTNLTLDHVKPASKGGKFTWDNMITACTTCNGKKGDRTLKQLGWTLRRLPREPSAAEVVAIGGMGILDVRTPPQEWTSYLFPGQIPLMSSKDASLL